jgi:predicted nucleotidyltransferase
MSVVGLEQAYKAAAIVRLSVDPPLEVKVSSLPGLVVLKLVAWDEKYPERDNDAQDILLIMQEYEKARGMDLYKEEPELLREEEYDHTLVGIRLLGRDIAALADETTLRAVLGILENEEKQWKLAFQMTSSPYFDERQRDAALQKIDKLVHGIKEHRP